MSEISVASIDLPLPPSYRQTEIGLRSNIALQKVCRAGLWVIAGAISAGAVEELSNGHLGDGIGFIVLVGLSLWGGKFSHRAVKELRTELEDVIDEHHRFNADLPFIAHGIGTQEL